MDITEQIAADMRALPVETRKAVRPALRAAGQQVAEAAKGNASWSSRIPGTIRVRTSFRFEREGVEVIAGNASTPHARPFEDVRQRGSFRHPVFADAANKTRRQWTWVSQTSRPFLFPAARATEAATTAAMRSVLDTAAVSIGFH